MSPIISIACVVAALALIVLAVGFAASETTVPALGRPTSRSTIALICLTLALALLAVSLLAAPLSWWGPADPHTELP